MKLRTVLPGLGIAAAGFGLAALVVDRSPMGLLAGVLGLIAGSLAVVLPRREDSADTAGSLAVVLPRREDSADTAGRRPAGDNTAGRRPAGHNTAGRRPAGHNTAGRRPEASAGPDHPRTPGADEPITLDGPPPGPESADDQPAAPEDVTPAGGAADGALVDPDTGLFGEEFFRVVTESRIAAARRHLRPVSLVLVEVVEGLPAAPTPVDSRTVSTSITTTLREADIACRLHNGYFALLLEDTPENGAIWTVERIRRHLAETTAGKTLWAGVACYPAHAFSHAELVAAAENALVAAREWQQDRIEVATLAP
ncbi:MAG: diguanylate cyclase domain-containing protein [Acidimicrobiales bacterium]